MPVYISLLRAVNVTGHNSIKMAGLKQMFESLGFSAVTTYLQSGNVVFTSERSDTAALRKRIETAIGKRFGMEVTVIVKTAAEFTTVIEGNPFDHERVFVTFLAAAPASVSVDELNKVRKADELIIVKNSIVYFLCPGSYGTTKLSNIFLEKKIGVAATTRNWKTVTALAELAGSL